MVNDTLYKMVAAVLVALALFGLGYFKGIQHEARAQAEYRIAVETQAAKQAANTEAKIKNQQRITEETVNEYSQAMDRLRAYHDSRRVRSNASRRTLPAVSATASVPDEVPADVVSDTGQLEAQCAETTLNLLYLQLWVSKLSADGGS